MRIVVKIIVLFLIHSSSRLIAQTNLVPNWSFEDYNVCPNNAGQFVNYLDSWYNPTGGTPDYFNQCGFGTPVGVPDNGYGNQVARTGNAYAGLILCFLPLGFNGREYISVKLLDSLQNGRKYCISFYLNLADANVAATDAVGLHFSKNKIINTSQYNLSLQPQVKNIFGTTISDTSNWLQVWGEYVAFGGEEYLTIGNFSVDALTYVDTLYPSNFLPYIYVYIDDVSVTLCETSPPEPDTLFLPNIFTPNGDGQNDVFAIGSDGLEELSCSIFNRWGAQVAQLNLPDQGWDGRVNGIECNAGVYFYVLTGKDKEGKEVVRKGNVTLYR